MKWYFFKVFQNNLKQSHSNVTRGFVHYTFNSSETKGVNTWPHQLLDPRVCPTKQQRSPKPPSGLPEPLEQLLRGPPSLPWQQLPYRIPCSGEAELQRCTFLFCQGRGTRNPPDGCTAHHTGHTVLSLPVSSAGERFLAHLQQVQTGTLIFTIILVWRIVSYTRWIWECKS